MKAFSFRSFLFLFLSLFFFRSSQAATITVNSFREGTPGNSLCELSEAILSANSDSSVDGCNAGSGADVIILPPGFYTITDPSAALPLVTSDITIESEGAMIKRSSSALPFGVMSVSSGILTLKNIIISGGLSDPGSGGGIFIEGGSDLTLIHSTVSNNQASVGGGIFCLNSDDSVTLIDSAIQNNTATAFQGGGISCNRITIVNSTVSGNQVTGPNGMGGGIFGGDSLTIVNSTIADNKATDANSSAGGVFFLFPGVFLKNAIIAGNTATIGPDCIFSNPTLSNGNNVIGNSSGCNLTVSAGDHFDVPTGLDLFADDGTPGNGHFPLLATSPAVNAGDPMACPPEDQLGQARVGICDIGAIEAKAMTNSGGSNSGGAGGGGGVIGAGGSGNNGSGGGSGTVATQSTEGTGGCSLLPESKFHSYSFVTWVFPFFVWVACRGLQQKKTG